MSKSSLSSVKALVAAYGTRDGHAVPVDHARASISLSQYAKACDRLAAARGLLLPWGETARWTPYDSGPVAFGGMAMAMYCDTDSAGVFTRIPCEGVELEARLWLPSDARAMIVFAESSGSGLNNWRDQHLAASLQGAGFATLLLDLYTPRELEEDGDAAHLRFAIRMLQARLSGVMNWLAEQSRGRGLSVGLLGAGTGAAAALMVAAAYPHRVGAVVCRGGRPDMAGASLLRVLAPTLLIVGGLDYVVADLNRIAMERLTPDRHLLLIPHAGHQFEEPGAIEAVAAATMDWFAHHMMLPAAIAS